MWVQRDVNHCLSTVYHTGLHSAVGNMSGNRCESDCRSMGLEFD